MDITEQRRALQQRWTSAAFRDSVRQRLQRLATVPDTTAAVVLPEEEKDTANNKTTLSPHRQRLLGALQNRRLPSLLETEVKRAVAEVASAAKHWQQTAAFVTFDVPCTASDFLRWIEALVSGTEANKDVEAAVYEIFPAMKTNPDTAMFMKEMILPFRSMMMMHVVLTVLRSLRLVRVAGSSVRRESNSSSGAKTKNSAESKDSTEPSSSSSKESRRGSSSTTVPPATAVADIDSLASSIQLQDEAVDLEQMEKIALASHKHAALHARNLRDVFTIDAMLPDHPEQLREHIKAVKQQGGCASYALYHLIYLDSTEHTTDAEWISLMQPLASSGLAHAQLDVGLCHLANKEPEKGAPWLERAAKLGHTTAMLELGKFYFAEAMDWNAKGGLSGTVPSNVTISPAVMMLRVREAKGKALTEKAAAAKANRGEAERTSSSVSTNIVGSDVAMLVKEALKWLEELQDAPTWDGDTPRAKAQGLRILKEIEADAKKRKEFETAREVILKMEKQERRNKWLTVGAIVVLVLSYVIWKWLQYLELMRVQRVQGEGGPDPWEVVEELTHVPAHRVIH